MAMNGILLLDKEEGWTSNDVVVKLKGILHQRRVGHSGTLDPMATGLLCVFVGRATRGVPFSEAQQKSYRTVLHLGTVTDTQDITGNVIYQRDVDVTTESLVTALKHFEGMIEQIPPMYSAIKSNGKRLYELARKGETVERTPRKIEIFYIKLIQQLNETDFVLDVVCSKGTYIRTLCNDIGEYLGCGGCMAALRRTSVGSFNVSKAEKISEIQKAADEGKINDYIIPIDTLFLDYPSINLSSRETEKIKNGNSIKNKTGNINGKARLYSDNGEFLAYAEASPDEIKIIKSFYEVKT